MSPQAEKRFEFAWRVLAAVGAVFMGGVAFSGYAKLPAQLQTVRSTVDSFRTEHDNIHTLLDSLRQNQEKLREGQADILCLMLAERQHNDWLQCKVGHP